MLVVWSDLTYIHNKVDRLGENFPKSIQTMFFGWENATGSALIKGKN